MTDNNNFLSIPRFDGDYDYWCILMKNLLWSMLMKLLRSKEYWTEVEQGYEELKPVLLYWLPKIFL